MFERFTNRSRRVVVLAQQEALGLNHDYIGTEHILLGLIAEGQGPAAKILSSLDITLDSARAKIEEVVGRGEQPPTGHIPFTPRSKKVLELSLREALRYEQNYVGTGHILLSILTDGEGPAATFLMEQGVDANLVEDRLRREFADDPGTEAAPAGEDPVTLHPARPLAVKWHQILPLVDSIEARLTAIEEQLGIAADGPREEARRDDEPPEDSAASD
jgi:ATP-dependent Clp protease ATP-binding subunit ClpC